MSNKIIRIGDNSTIKWENDCKLYCLHIMRDDDAANPREDDDGLLTTMACWHRDYKLGDDIGKMSPEEWWCSLVDENVPNDELAKALVGGELSIKAVERPDGEYDVKYKDDDGTWIDGCHCAYRNLKYFTVNDLEVKECMKLMEEHAVWLPLWIYEHSGITMSCGGRGYPYNDRWDSSQAGWILMTKANALTIYGKDDWRERALQTMQHDVEIYDEWLTGECYGYRLYEADKPADSEEPDWGEDETDSCWGFYGDDIIKNDMAWSVGCGLTEAIESGNYEVGTAERHTVTYWTF